MNFLNINILKTMISRITLSLLFSLLIAGPVSAQWWNLYGPGQLEETIETTNGDLVAGGYFNDSVNGLIEGLVLRTDSLGNELWRLTFPELGNFQSVNRIVETNNGDLVISVTIQNPLSSPSNYSVKLYKISASGSIIWERLMDELENFLLSEIKENPTTNELIIGAGTYIPIDTDSDSLTAKLIVLDELGNVNYQREYAQFFLPISNTFSPIIHPIPNGYIMALGEWIHRLNSDLSTVWSQNAPGYEPEEITKITESEFIGLSFDAFDVSSTYIQLFRFDLAGTILWDTSLNVQPSQLTKLFKKPDETFNLIYRKPEFSPLSFLQQNIFAIRSLSPSGQLGSESILPIIFQNATDVNQTENGDLVFMGKMNTFPSNIQSGFLLRTDCELSDFNNIVTGKIFVDEDFDCTYDSTEQLLGNYPIQLIHQSGLPYYGISDNSGEYTINVGSGSYQTSAIPQSVYEIPCTPEIVTFNIADTSLILNLPLQRIIECPQMTVSVGAPFIRRCFENTYSIQYCNSGTADAMDAYVEIMLDSFTIYENSSIPLITQNGSVLTFDLGDIQSGECANFTITTTLSCDAELGQNHCVAAHIYPDSICLTPSPNWDGSSIQVSAQCTEDSVRFFINNIGTGDMLAPLDYIVIQDEILFIQDEFQLNSGGSLLRSFPADGSTYRLEADQAVGHPGNSMPSATVEGCGEWPFATGFFGYFPQDDNDPFVDFDCQPNIGSYDPNDKSAFPIGYGNQNIIDPSTQLEYKIRFQNTGTDTAFNVSISDVLSDFLDISTLKMGAASHPYTWRLEEQGTLFVDFPNIQLPDSTTNFAESHGFISFKIALNETLENTEFLPLRNNASIFFDFNEPVITNTVFHRIDSQFVDIILSIGPIDVIQNRVKVAPNPIHRQTTLTFPEDSKFPMIIKLFSQDGRLVHTQTINDINTELNLEKFSKGVYFYGIYDNQGLWASGKLVLQ